MSASSKDILPTQRGWIHDLARAEVVPGAEQALGLAGSADPQQLIEESAVAFLTEMRESLGEYCRIFNSYSEASSRFGEVKVYGLAQTPADFMLYRNQVKLLFTNPQAGLVQISFARHARGALAVDGVAHGAASGMESEFSRPAELLAQLGPFRDVRWTFQSELVTADQVAKFYFGEFVRVSRDTRRARAGNQLLLEQIKTLLQEKGLDL